jgi:catechol 2,3-dioxygenase-like lactoylglutathione lyase family enzyme
MLTKISHITLFVHNQEDALNFYMKLGFVIHTDAMFGPMRWLTLNLPGQGDLELVLIKAETPEEKALVGKQGAARPLISFESADCFNDYLVLKTAGIEFPQEPAQQAWGTSVAFKDLYGNMLYIAQPI